MCDCRLSRQELLAEKNKRIDASQQQQKSPSRYSPSSDIQHNVAKLCPHPRDPDFLVFCSITEKQAETIILANRRSSSSTTGTLYTPEDLDYLFEETTIPKWFCSECKHTIARHASGGNEFNGTSSIVVQSSPRNSYISNMMDAQASTLQFFCSGKGTVPNLSNSDHIASTFGKVVAAADAGWQLQQRVDNPPQPEPPVVVVQQHKESPKKEEKVVAPKEENDPQVETTQQQESGLVESFKAEETPEKEDEDSASPPDELEQTSPKKEEEEEQTKPQEKQQDQIPENSGTIEEENQLKSSIRAQLDSITKKVSGISEKQQHVVLESPN